MDRKIGAFDRTQHPTADDAFLLSLVQSGDERAMATLYDRYSKVVYSIALRVLSDPALAEDVLQEVFMQLWRTPGSFTAVERNLGEWLAVLSRNRSINALRRKHQADPMDAIAFATPTDLSSEAERNRLAERSRALLQQLPSEQRNTLKMAFFDGLTHSEIAEVTGDSVTAVKTTLRSALLALREAFQP
ncbi:MAG: RNA polymerase sigma factor [Acidobacteriaceae bacterium]